MNRNHPLKDKGITIIQEINRTQWESNPYDEKIITRLADKLINQFRIKSTDNKICKHSLFSTRNVKIHMVKERKLNDFSNT